MLAWSVISFLIGLGLALVTPQISVAVTVGVWFLIATVAAGVSQIQSEMRAIRKALGPADVAPRRIVDAAQVEHG